MREIGKFVRRKVLLRPRALRSLSLSLSFSLLALMNSSAPRRRDAVAGHKLPTRTMEAGPIVHARCLIYAFLDPYQRAGSFSYLLVRVWSGHLFERDSHSPPHPLIPLTPPPLPPFPLSAFCHAGRGGRGTGEESEKKMSRHLHYLTAGRDLR